MVKRFLSFHAVFCIFGVFLLALAFSSSCWGQATSQGTVTVTVYDQQGSIVQGAKLELTDTASGKLRAADTGEFGGFTFTTLPIGTYRLSVSRTGFKNSVVERVNVEGGRTTDVKVTMQVGQVEEKVVVSTESAPLVETTSNAIATTLDVKQIEDLPLLGRDISGLAFLTPGYSGTPGNGTWNGLPVIAQGNSVDGVISSTSRMKFGGNTAPGAGGWGSVDTFQARLEDLQEMTVQTSQTDLNQGVGQASMGVNFVTRQGTNVFHGRIFEDFRNSDLDANSWLNNASGLPRNPLILNEFGGSVGGPIIKEKLFFFGSFSMAKQPGGFPATNSYLTPLAQQGIYTLPSTGQQVNLFTQVAQPNGLPTTANSAVATEQALINAAVTSGGATLVPTSDPNLETVRWNVSSPVTYYFPAFRVDYQATQKVRLDLSFQNTRANQPNSAAPSFPGATFEERAASNKSNNYISSLGVNWTVTPTITNQFRAGYYYNAYWYGYGAKPIWAPPSDLPQVSWALGNSGQNFNLPITTYYPIVNAIDNAVWAHNKHTVTFGFSFYREQDHYWNPPDGIQNITLNLVNGDPAFGAFESYFANAASGDRTEAEQLYATLAGRISSIGPIGSGFPYQKATGQYATEPGQAYNLDELQKGWGLYVQDSFRLTPRLTLNYGLRWDFTGDDHDLTSAYHGATLAGIYGPSGTNNLFEPGTLTGTNDPTYDARSHQYAPWNVSPQPTIGIAWNPSYSDGVRGKLFGGSKTVIRAGFDIKRFTEPQQYFWNDATNHGLAYFQSFGLNAVGGGGTGTFTPGTLSLDQAPSIPKSAYLLSPPAYAASLPQSDWTWNYYWGGAGIDPKIPQPYVQEWNLGIQRELGAQNVLEVRYLGHRAVHQWIMEDLNEINIFENGFLKQFQAAQGNLKACMANPSCAANPSFQNQGLPGQVALPIFDSAFTCPSGVTCTTNGGYTNPGFINDLNLGAAGSLATSLAVPPAGGAPYICNMVGSALSPCQSQFGYTAPGAYPVNFFQINPYAQGAGTGQAGGGDSSWMTAAGYGVYNALQVDFRQRQFHGMQFDANYTYSHTLGLQPDTQWLGNVNEFTVRDLRRSYGPTTYDLRHVLHVSGTYDLPFGRGKALLTSANGVVDHIVGGWTLGTILTYQTGLPFQLLGGYNTVNDYGDGGLLFNGISVSQLQSAVGVHPGNGAFAYIINPNLLKPSASCPSSFITGVCQNTTAGTFGSNPWLYGPHMWNDDISISKSVPITERVHFIFQAEMLNAFNHPNWGIPGAAPYYVGSNNVQSNGFGVAATQSMVPNSPNGGARLIELRANISF